MDELHDQQLKAGRIMAERGDRGLHPLDVAMVIGAPNVDHQVEAAVELVLVVGDVGSEVGVLAAGALKYTILVVVELGRPQPESFVAGVGAAIRIENRERLGDRRRAAGVERRLVEPIVEDDAQASQAALSLGDHQLNGEPRDLIYRQVAGAGNIGRQRDDVFALVAVLGRLLTARAGLNRNAKRANLRAGVVDVVLAMNLVTDEAEEARQRVAIDGIARSADVDRAGRVGADELDVDL